MSKNEANYILLISSTPISINGNAELAAIATAGNGSSTNPYIIENYMINATSSGTDGLLINNTNQHFILRNCSIFGATISGKVGIRLENVTNATLTNNILYNNSNGIGLNLCHDNIINNNSIQNHSYLGIFLVDSCYSNTIANNTIYNNGLYGNCFSRSLPKKHNNH